MEQQININAQHGLEWQIILTENETVIVRRSTPIVTPAQPRIAEPATAQAGTARSSAPAHPRIYANMR